VNGVIGVDLLECLANTDRIHGDSGLELRTAGAAVAHGGGPFRVAPPSEVFNGARLEKPDHLKLLFIGVSHRQ